MFVGGEFFHKFNCCITSLFARLPRGRRMKLGGLGTRLLCYTCQRNVRKRTGCSMSPSYKSVMSLTGSSELVICLVQRMGEVIPLPVCEYGYPVWSSTANKPCLDPWGFVFTPTVLGWCLRDLCRHNPITKTVAAKTNSIVTPTKTAMVIAWIRWTVDGWLSLSGSSVSVSVIAVGLNILGEQCLLMTATR